MRRTFLALCGSLLVACAAGTQAQERYPSHPVKLIVPSPAGGPTDAFARALGEHLAQKLGQPVVVDNRPGAGGLVASQALVQSQPDGYTLIMVASGHATNPFLYPKLPYDTFKDLVAQNLSKSDRKYLVWMDANEICGIGESYDDRKLGPSNKNNGPTGIPGMMARIDQGCWGEYTNLARGSTEAHELTHTLGAVLSGAPHATRFGHCWDSYDVMCYVDGPGTALHNTCPFTHQQLILTEAIWLPSSTKVNPSGGTLAANPMFSAGLERIGFAAEHIFNGSAQRVLAHATSGPVLQQNLVAVLEGR